MTNSCQAYEFCDPRPLALPDRSTLFGPEPLGIGTGQVEGIHSYISRLVQAHGVHLLTLARYIDSFRPELPHAPGSVRPQHPSPSNSIVSCARFWTQERVQILERLTARPELHALTLLRLSQVIEDQGCWSKSRAWCPQCYAQWQDRGLPIFQPLTWSLNVVPMCSQHRVWLITECPTCRQPQSRYSTGWPLGCCTACGEWLGSHSKAEARRVKRLCAEPAMKPPVLWQHWASEAVADLLRATTSDTPDPALSRLAQNLRQCLDQVQAQPVQLAQWIGVPDTLVSHWLDASLKPTLSVLLLVAYALSVPLVTLVLGAPEALRAQWQPLPRRTLAPWSRRVQGKEETRILLDHEWERYAADCPSLEDIASRVQRSPRYLQSHFPAQCALIQHRHQLKAALAPDQSPR
jgi:hypothetical protein